MRSQTLALVAFVILSMPSGAQDVPPASSPRPVAEPRDIAFRRAKAFHDMYAGAEESRALSDAMRAYVESRGRGPGERRARPLPIDFPSRALDERLKVLTERRPARTFPGATFRMLRSTARSIPGTSWHNLGPTNFAGRVSALAVDPTNSSVIYRGTAGGGLWKSQDKGVNWTPLTDSLGNLSVGAVAVARSNTQVIYVGTGEGALGIDGIDGIGLIKSTDGGQTWTIPTSVLAPKFFALSVHPSNPDELLAATSNGISKSTDGGNTWTPKLSQFAATELVRVPGSPSTILASAWDIRTFNSTWNGYLYRSTDGGETWTKIGGAGVESLR